MSLARASSQVSEAPSGVAFVICQLGWIDPCSTRRHLRARCGHGGLHVRDDSAGPTGRGSPPFSASFFALGLVGSTSFEVDHSQTCTESAWTSEQRSASAMTAQDAAARREALPTCNEVTGSDPKHRPWDLAARPRATELGLGVGHGGACVKRDAARHMAHPHMQSWLPLWLEWARRLVDTRVDA